MLNLAIADLLTLCVGLPFEIYMSWNQYPWSLPDFLCNLKAWIAETTRKWLIEEEKTTEVVNECHESISDWRFKKKPNITQGFVNIT
ncbi:unnamed protein product [Toxocara canis]|uniref:G_PROTEIN_RECEP_F1_2 domain-containing protein n=1 Tax=Toxocara canis TaxID=6265 RepID=A0A3P7FGH3_TOXCA|nr:unnamed protein product [Toxocara canis]